MRPCRTITITAKQSSLFLTFARLQAAVCARTGTTLLMQCDHSYADDCVPRYNMLCLPSFELFPLVENTVPSIVNDQSSDAVLAFELFFPGAVMFDFEKCLYQLCEHT